MLKFFPAYLIKILMENHMRIHPTLPSFASTQGTQSKGPWTQKEITAFSEAGLELPKISEPRNRWSCIITTISELAFATIIGIGIVLLTGAVFGTLPFLLTPCLIVGGASLAILAISVLAKKILDCTQS